MTTDAASTTRLPRRADVLRSAWTLALLGALGLGCAASVVLGARSVTAEELFGALSGRVDSIGSAAVALRLPRTAMAALAGAALGLAGAVMQGVTRNPLADPGILGVNAGAALAIVLAMAWFGIDTLPGFITVAILGAALAAAFVWTVGSLGRGGATPLKLALAGTATAIALRCVAAAVVLPRPDIAGGVWSWQIGGVGGTGWDIVLPVLPVLLAGAALVAVSARALNLLALGDDTAAGLGLRVVRARAVAALGAVTLCGATTAACGPIAFVGLVVPHLLRALVGTDHRWLIPLSALGGAVLLICADVAGRLVARPAELDVGIVTALLGAPVFIWIVRRKRLRDL